MTLKQLLKTCWFRPISAIAYVVFKIFGCETESKIVLITDEAPQGIAQTLPEPDSPVS